MRGNLALPPTSDPSSNCRRAKPSPKPARRSDILIFLTTAVSDGRLVGMITFGFQFALGLVSAFASSKSNGRYIVQISGNAVRIEPKRMHQAGHGLRTL
jgi:hypothetical protein